MRRGYSYFLGLLPAGRIYIVSLLRYTPLSARGPPSEQQGVQAMCHGAPPP